MIQYAIHMCTCSDLYVISQFTMLMQLGFYKSYKYMYIKNFVKHNNVIEAD